MLFSQSNIIYHQQLGLWNVYSMIWITWELKFSSQHQYSFDFIMCLCNIFIFMIKWTYAYFWYRFIFHRSKILSPLFHLLLLTLCTLELYFYHLHWLASHSCSICWKFMKQLFFCMMLCISNKWVVKLKSDCNMNYLNIDCRRQHYHY